MSSDGKSNLATLQTTDDDSSTFDDATSSMASSRFTATTSDIDFGLSILKRADAGDSLSLFAQHPLTLHFKDRDLEYKFTEKHYGPTLVYYRIITILVVFFYVIFFVKSFQVMEIEDMVVRGIQLVFGIVVAIVVNVIGLILQFWRRKRMKQTVIVKNKPVTTSTSPPTTPRNPTSSSGTLLDDQSSHSSDPTSNLKRPRYGCCSFFDLLDCFLFTPYTCFLMSIHAFTSGFITIGLSTPFITAAIAFFLLFRARVFPSVVLTSILGPIVHVLSHLLTLVVGRTSRGTLKLIPETTFEIAFGNFEVFLVGLVIVVSVGIQYENNVRRLFVVSERSRRLCEAVEIENGRERALLKNVFPEKLLPMFLSQEEEGIRYASSGKAMIGMVINDIAGFTSFCSRTETQVVFRFLNQVYYRFDVRAQAYGLSKVKTIGDSWEGCIFHVEGEDDEECCDSSQDAAICVLTALGMVRDFDRVLAEFGFSSSSSSTLALRSGVSISADSWVYLIGSTMSGAMLSFDVIGEAVKRSSLLEARSEEGEVFVCETVREVLMDDERFDFEEVEVDGSWFDSFRVSMKEGEEDELHPLSLQRKVVSIEESGKWRKVGSDTGSLPEKNNRVVSFLRRLCSTAVEICFRQNFAVCEDCVRAQSTFVRIVFGIVALVVFFYSIMSSIIVYGQIWFAIFSMDCLAALIVLVCVIGALLVKNVGSSVMLQWLCFLLFEAWGICSVVFACYLPRRDGLSMVPAADYVIVSSIVTISPFLSLVFPSLPALVKVVGPLWSLLATAWVDSVWPMYPGIQSIWFSFSLNFLTVYLSSIFGLLFSHVNLLNYHKGRERLLREFAALQEETKRNEGLLDSALPRPITERLLTSNGLDRAFEYFPQGGSLFFVVSLSPSISGTEVVRILDTLFGEFDSLLSSEDNTSVVKVKSTGCKYLCVSGVSDDEEDEAVVVESLGTFSFLMLNEARRLRESGTIDPSAEFRIGLHLGGFCAGLAGSTRWLWDCYGDTMNVACRLADSAGRDEIHCSEGFGEEWQKVPRETSDQVLKKTGGVDLKGIGQVNSFLLDCFGED